MTERSAPMFSKSAIRWRNFAQQVVAELPDGMRCHEIARIVAALLPDSARVVVMDGVTGAVEHSWLVVSQGTDVPVILDPYAMGRLPAVQLVAQGPHLHHATYVQRQRRDDIDEAMVAMFVSQMARFSDG